MEALLRFERKSLKTFSLRWILLPRSQILLLNRLKEGPADYWDRLFDSLLPVLSKNNGEANRDYKARI